MQKSHYHFLNKPLDNYDMPVNLALLNKLKYDLFEIFKEITLFMIEKIVNRDGEQVTEVRSAAGKLLLIKTKKGYEIKCPRTKIVCLIKYEQMLNDCFACLGEDAKIFRKTN